jgi:hypothetical protein
MEKLSFIKYLLHVRKLVPVYNLTASFFFFFPPGFVSLGRYANCIMCIFLYIKIVKLIVAFKSEAFLISPYLHIVLFEDVNIGPLLTEEY